MRENPNTETAAALNEYAAMKAHPEHYKQYSSFKDAMDEDPFYSEQNQACLHKSIAQMEAAGLLLLDRDINIVARIAILVGVVFVAENYI